MRASVSFVSSRGVVPLATNAWKPEIAPQAMVMKQNGQIVPPKSGPVPFASTVTAGVAARGGRAQCPARAGTPSRAEPMSLQLNAMPNAERIATDKPISTMDELAYNERQVRNLDDRSRSLEKGLASLEEGVATDHERRLNTHAAPCPWL